MQIRNFKNLVCLGMRGKKTPSLLLLFVVAFFPTFLFSIAVDFLIIKKQFSDFSDNLTVAKCEFNKYFD